MCIAIGYLFLKFKNEFKVRLSKFTFSLTNLVISGRFVVKIRNLRVSDGVKSDLQIALPAATITLPIVDPHFNLAA